MTNDTGLDDLTWTYHQEHQLTPQSMITQYRDQEVVAMVGELDTKPAEDGFECRFQVQGPNRNVRAHEYHQHVTDFFWPLAVNHQLFEVAGASHGHKTMFKSGCGKRWIFDDLGSACP